MTLKLSFFYNQGRQGFSETYYVNSGSTPQDFVNGLTRAQLVAFQRLHSLYAPLFAIRASTVEPPRKSALRVIRGELQGSITSINPDQDPDVVSTDAVVRLVGTQGIPRRVYLRGLIDTDVVRDAYGNDLPPAGFLKRLDNYYFALKDIGCAIRYTVLPPTGGAAWTQIYQLVPGPDSHTTNIQFAGDDFPVGTEVGKFIVLQGIPASGAPRFPRVAQIIQRQTVGGKFLTIAYRLLVGGNVSTPRGRLTPLVYGYDPILTGQFERYSEHKTGKPIGSLRGRSKGLSRVR